jgi:hypothetical protein
MMLFKQFLVCDLVALTNFQCCIIITTVLLSKFFHQPEQKFCNRYAVTPLLPLYSSPSKEVWTQNFDCIVVPSHSVVSVICGQLWPKILSGKFHK